MEEKIKARVKELYQELDVTVGEIKAFQESSPTANLESLEKVDSLTKKLLVIKSALAELNALLE